MSAVEGERRQLTTLFCDLVDSTALAGRLELEDWRDTLAAYHRTAAEVIERYDGHVVQYLGDGVTACFGYPLAHGDDAARAVYAGLALVDAMTTLSQELTAIHPARLAVRVGINTGTVVVGPGTHGTTQVFGDVLHVAARVQGMAEPDSVLITAATNRLVAGLFEVTDRGASELKGVPDPVVLHRVIGARGVRSLLDVAGAHGLTPFVDRDEDRRLLASRWSLAQGGAGQAVFIMGEPGIGKSRLVRWLRDHVSPVPHTWIGGAGTPYARNTSFHPVIEMAWQLLSVSGHEGPTERFVRLEERLTRAGLRPAEALPVLAPLLSLPASARYPAPELSPEAQRQRTLATLVAWFLGTARLQPMVLVLEDLHWVDPSTLDLHRLLVEHGAEAPLLQVYSARPEHTIALATKSHCTLLSLSRLPRTEVREMIGHLASRSLPEALVETLLVRSDGVPLFVEEITKAALECGESEATSAVPTTLQNSLMARLDRLGPAKEVAQIGAAIGREFSRLVLDSVAGVSPAELDRHLQRLVDAGLLYAVGPPNEAVYQFKHALIRDAAYDSLLKRRRRELHRLIADTLAERVPALAESQPELLAHHYTLGGNLEPAMVAWQRAGRQAAGRSALLEAVDHYGKALDILATLPESPERAQRELVLQIAKGTALMAIRGYGAGDLLGPYTRARQLAEELHDVRRLLFVVSGLWVSSFIRGDFPAARELANEALRVAEETGVPMAFAWARVFQGITRYATGDVPAGFEFLERAIEVYDERQFRDAQTDPGVPALGYASMSAWHLGLVDLARRRATETLALGRRLGKAYDLAYAHALATFIHIYLREPDEVLAIAEPLIELARAQHFPFYLGLGLMNRGWAWAAQGRAAEGVAQLREGFEVYRSTGTRTTYDLYLGLLADAQARAGDVDDALATIENALAGCVPYEVDCPELLRQRAELLARRGVDAATVETGFRDAIALAHRMGSRGYELRSATSGARWLAEVDRGDDARAMLAPIAARFPAGPDTPELRAARELLAELPR